jgi:hypothetical protein
MAHARGEPKVWSVVRVPSVAEEDDRRLHRERDRLINERGQHVNRIKGLCAVHGIYDYELMHSKRMLHLERLRTVTGDQLPRRFKEEINRELQRLELVLRMIKAIETERDAIASAKASTHTNAKKIQKLVKLRATRWLQPAARKCLQRVSGLAPLGRRLPQLAALRARARLGSGIARAHFDQVRYVRQDITWLLARNCGFFYIHAPIVSQPGRQKLSRRGFLRRDIYCNRLLARRRQPSSVPAHELSPEKQPKGASRSISFKNTRGQQVSTEKTIVRKIWVLILGVQLCDF